MKVNESWLREWVDPPLSVEAIGARLTMAGLELDGISPAAPSFEGVVVARIAEIAPHPDADKLRVCQVDAGEGQRVQVVCGAANAARGMTVALATVGAVLPGGMKIRKAKLRGVESLGMLCSAAELGLEESSSGIMALPQSAPLGEDLRRYLELDDAVLEIDITPNRADCFSVTGVARDLAVATDSPFDPPQVEPVAAACDDALTIHIDAPEACPHYAGRIIRDVDVVAETPLWMRERLRRCGIRSLGPIVDVTNYVMLELGQPMHAFDLSKLEGGIVVRFARSGEKLGLLDGNEVELDNATLVIADQSSALALAGVMGGEASAVSAQTRDIFLESAFFQPTVIAGKARQYGLHTESSHRFERGVDFRLQEKAIERATGLIVSICGGRPGPVTIDRHDVQLPQRAAIDLRRGRIPKVLGIEMEDAAVERIFTGLGCTIEPVEAGWTVLPPSFRFDLQIEVDLIEELARIYGYDRIPAQSRSAVTAIEARSETAVPLSVLKRQLNHLGYQEAITYSFVDASLEAQLNPGHQPLSLLNPISSDLAVMRSTLWGGLLKTVGHNQRRQQNRVRVFESGLVFQLQGDELAQVEHIGGAAYGDVWPEQWAQAPRKHDFFDTKGDVETLLRIASIQSRVEWRPADHPALHPGQSAELFLDDRSIGHVGALHPNLQQKLGFDQPVFLFELQLEPLRQRDLPHFEPLPRYPSVRRDLALVVDENVSYAQLVASIEALELEVIRNYRVFDVYQGKGVASGRKSLALSLILQDFSSTLSEEEVERVVTLVIERLNADVGATLRE